MRITSFTNLDLDSDIPPALKAYFDIRRKMFNDRWQYAGYNDYPMPPIKTVCREAAFAI